MIARQKFVLVTLALFKQTIPIPGDTAYLFERCQ